jgi:hypothetical protein
MTLVGLSVEVFNSHAAYKNAFKKAIAAQCAVSEDMVIITSVVASRRRLVSRRLADGVTVNYDVRAATEDAARATKTSIAAISTTEQSSFVSKFSSKFEEEKAIAASAGDDTLAAVSIPSDIVFTVAAVSSPKAVSCTDLPWNDGSVWDDGTGYGCKEYGAGGMSCGPFGGGPGANEPNANQACCSCGGGKLATTLADAGASVGGGNDDGGMGVGVLVGIIAAVVVAAICGGVMFWNGKSSDDDKPRGASSPPPGGTQQQHANAPPVTLGNVEPELRHGQVSGRDKPEYTF